MYTTHNFKTKKALKEAVKAGHRVTVFQPNSIMRETMRVISDSHQRPLTIALEGPHAPQPHRWYATAILENGRVTKVLR